MTVLVVGGVVLGIALATFVATRIAQRHQCGDAVAVVDHALAPHLRRVGGEHGGDQRSFEQF